MLNSLKVRLNYINNNIIGNYINTKELNEKELEKLYHEIMETYKTFKAHNHDNLERIRKDRLKMNIHHERDFSKHLQSKLTFLTERLDLLQMKYNGYKKWYDTSLPRPPPWTPSGSR